MASKWEPHAEEIEALFRRGDSYRAISALLLERYGLPLDPAGLHRWWKNKLAKRQARDAALRDLTVGSKLAHGGAAITEQQTLAVEQVQKEDQEAKQKRRQAISLDLDTEKIDKDNYMKKLLEESEIKADLTANTLLKK
ncbi:hypothetical protein [Acidovorax sp. Root402]|uniref:hypothetical protein n=1 Tax=Acidovorax sp. Root402 TaxID=1736527 RepID=UPI0006FCE363|nr:hypothetical protein [Acidovorax sp. Root402]KQW29917.1 hypothetical protein ASC83_22730 [Acidovorax sp. Root402]